MTTISTTPTTDTSATDLFTATVPKAFARTVATLGDREALSSADVRWTYAELDMLARRFATALQARGLTAGQRVGVHMERRPELYPLFIGILQAGLTVVPFNPDHPESHLPDLVGVARPDLTVTSEKDAPGVDATQVVRLESLLEEAPTPTDLSTPGPGPEDPAFILFTSGSTGTPKGVEIVHRGLARVSRGLSGYEPGPGDVFLQLAQPSFAASTTDIWTCLLRGARLVVPPPKLPSLSEMARIAELENVTVLNLPVGLFNRLVDGHPEMVAKARWIIVSGDFPSKDHLARAVDLTNGTVFNAFGCTENSALTAVYEITKEDLTSEAGAVPVGHPMPGVVMSVRDEELREVPPGETGELCLSGAGLARGYIDDMERTAARFVDVDRDLVLRTGDLAVMRDDRAFILAGRMDHLIKVRGFRVEPQQVELAAEAVSGVGRAVVHKAPGDAATEELHLSFTVQEAAADANEVRSRLMTSLRDALPDYMVPTHLHPLEQFPLNPNGKVDRQALSEGLSTESTSEVADSAPATAQAKTDHVTSSWQKPSVDCPATGDENLIEVVTRLVGEVTGIRTIGADDDLLDFGVTSLHLIDLGARLEESVRVQMAPDDLFTAGTSRGIADRIRHERKGS